MFEDKSNVTNGIMNYIHLNIIAVLKGNNMCYEL